MFVNTEGTHAQERVPCFHAEPTIKKDELLKIIFTLFIFYRACRNLPAGDGLRARQRKQNLRGNQEQET